MSEPYRSSMNEAELAVWRASLTPDEKLAAAIPPGWQFELVWAAYFKAVLTTENLPPAERLSYLEFLNTCAIGPASVAVIQPASTGFMQIVADAFRLDPPDSESRPAMTECLTRPEVFFGLAQLCPSILDAIRARVGRAA